ncbi:DUF7782 domain-containing protein [Corynebacterium auris]|uniref:DUF7782 domain-containing protein n=1 Tax=Corynebacterium auris TaxID=44750 RepID=UPI0025B2F49B|nr:methyltransferase [Corynebacterium auris]WJY68211.1 Ribosomal RNA small subunit methyltransferase C [Corynebacterium auris]
MTEPTPLTSAVSTLANELRSAGFTTESIAAHLGPDATEALFRGEPGVVFAACEDGSRLSGLIRFFLLREAVPGEALADLIGSRLTLSLLDASLAATLPSGEIRVALDVRPHVIAGENRLIVSDLDASTTEHVPGPDHVLGVGAASLSLLSASSCEPVDSVLDLGTGSGVQAVAQSGCATRVVATDLSARALELAAANLAANGIDNVELREGPWFEPVSGERFDRIVINPPFVVGPPTVGHVYRDSGLDLDGATQLVVSEAPDHLNPGGTAHILGAWVHTADGSWRSRVASWLPPRGVSAWVVQRDVVDPGRYVSTWLKDGSIDPRSREGIEKTARWLAHFRHNDVRAIGFGWVFIRAIGDAPTEVTAEEIPQPFTDPLAPEAAEYFERAAWLREASAQDIADARYVVRPGLAVEEVSVADSETGMGFRPEVIRLTRTDGPRFSHEADAGLRSIVAGLHPHGLPLRDIISLWAVSTGADAEDYAASAISAVTDLVRHGLLIPSDIAEIVS